MTKLTDTQLVILSTAAARQGGVVLPITPSVRAKGKTLNRVLTKLIKSHCVEEYVVERDEPSWRRDESKGAFGLRITDVGNEAVGRGCLPENQPSPPNLRPAKTILPVKLGTKNALIVKLMRRRRGASIHDMTRETGWLPHTCRAALTRLRHKGVAIERISVSNGGSTYVIPANQAGSA